MKRALITFVKAPVKGTVKTRLQADVDADKVLEIYKSLIVEIVSRCAQLKDIDRFLGCAPSKDDDFLKGVVRTYGMKSFNQRGNDLGEKIINAFKEYFKKGYSEIVLIGSDSPTIPINYIKKAFASLKKKDLVLGPCCDGGLYLIGAKIKILPDMFKDIPWDSSKVLNKTLDNLEALNMTIRLHLLPFWYDVDDINDLYFLKKHLRYLRKKTSISLL